MKISNGLAKLKVGQFVDGFGIVENFWLDKANNINATFLNPRTGLRINATKCNTGYKELCDEGYTSGNL
jgi:hypothetical protein